jgi:signal transduction histidine kinase/ActR/RegA family two-component response regulator
MARSQGCRVIEARMTMPNRCIFSLACLTTPRSKTALARTPQQTRFTAKDSRAEMKIRSYLALCVFALLIPVILFSWVAMSDMQNSAREVALRGLKETARSTALVVDREPYSAQTALTVLRASAYLESGNYAKFHEQAMTANYRNSRWAELWDENGQQLVNTSMPYGSPLPPPTAFAANETKTHWEAGKTVLSNLAPGRVSKSLQTSLTLPVVTLSGKRYLLAIVFSTDHFKPAVTDSRVPKEWVVAIIDGNGKFIARSLDAANKIGVDARPELVAVARKQYEGDIRHATLEGIESYDAFTRPSIGSWTVAVAAPVAGVDAAARHGANLALFGLTIALLFATLVAGIFARKLLHSIERATASAILLGRGQTPNSYHSGLIEVDKLHESLGLASSMLVAERTRREAAELERQSLLASERAARGLAEQQNKAKDDFLAMLGHELRNPLSAISAAIAIIEMTGRGSAHAERAFAIIARQSGHLGRIVEDLLDTARMMAGKIVLSPVRLDLAAAVRAALEAQAAAGHLGHVKMAVDTQPTFVEADPTRIDQIVTNLLSNAGKYTPSGGTVSVEVRPEKGQGVLRVMDTGIGMDAALLATIFEPFVQGERALDRAAGGLGIGLTMVKSLVELHGGSVRGESAGPSLGSRFTLSLPLAPALPPQSRSDAQAARSAAGILRKRVLLIEGNQDNRQMIAILLRIQGHDVIEAGNGAEGVRLALSEMPDVAIVDIGLPDMDGYAVARAIRASDTKSAIRLIALTGYGMASDIERAREAGFAEHITKPVNMEVLLRSVERLAPASWLAR